MCLSLPLSAQHTLSASVRTAVSHTPAGGDPVFAVLSCWEVPRSGAAARGKRGSVPGQRRSGLMSTGVLLLIRVCLMFRCQAWPVSVVNPQRQEQVVLGAFPFTQLDSGGHGRGSRWELLPSHRLLPAQREDRGVPNPLLSPRHLVLETYKCSSGVHGETC